MTPANHRRTTSLEQYLRNNLEAGSSDHSLRAALTPEGKVQFYVYATRGCSDTPSFTVEGDAVRLVPDLAFPSTEG